MVKEESYHYVSLSSVSNTLSTTHSFIGLNHGGSHTLKMSYTKSGWSYIDFIQ